MPKINKHIEIVRSTKAGFSSMSQVSCDATLAVLSKHYSRVGVSIVNNLSDLEALVVSRPDLVFLGMRFVPINETLGLRDPAKIWLSGYLDQHSIAYTGSPQAAHEFEFNKPLAKQRALDAGLDTSPFYVVKQNQPQASYDMPLGFPVFIKPTSRGGGLGIDSDSVAHNHDELNLKVRSIAESLDSDSLIEEYLSGREFSVAILKDQASGEYSIMPIEKIASLDERGQRIFSQLIKSTDSVRDLRVTDKDTRSKISQLAIDIFHALGARDYGRIDIRLDETGVPQFLEANLIPSIIKGYGSFPKACLLNINLDYEPMIIRITELALARSLDHIEDILEPSLASATALPFLRPTLESA